MNLGLASIVFDAEAMSAFALDDLSPALLEVIRRFDADLFVSAATLAEVTDGTNRDAVVRRALKAVEVVAVSQDIGLQAGVLRAGAVRSRRKPRDLTVDALVAATATVIPGRVAVLTSDIDDMRLLLAGTEVTVVEL